MFLTQIKDLMPFYIIQITSELSQPKYSENVQVSWPSNRIMSRQRSLKIHANVSNLEIVSSQTATDPYGRIFRLVLFFESTQFFRLLFQLKNGGKHHPNRHELSKRKKCFAGFYTEDQRVSLVENEFQSVLATRQKAFWRHLTSHKHHYFATTYMNVKQDSIWTAILDPKRDGRWLSNY